jgi:hypothetical protein
MWRTALSTIILFGALRHMPANSIINENEGINITDLSLPDHSKGLIYYISNDGKLVYGQHFNRENWIKYGFDRERKTVIYNEIVRGDNNNMPDEIEIKIKEKEKIIKELESKHDIEAQKFVRLVSPGLANLQWAIHDVSNDQEIFVGFVYGDQLGGVPSRKAFLWNKRSGFINLNPLLMAINEVNSDKWSFFETSPHGIRISGDGKTIGGTGWNESANHMGLFLMERQDSFRNQINIGEIELSGVIKSSSKGQWILSATSFRSPSGKKINLSPPRSKVVMLSEKLKASTGANLGSIVLVSGKDQGRGRPLVANFAQHVSMSSKKKTNMGDQKPSKGSLK